MNFLPPTELRAAIAAQFIPDISRMIKRGEPLQIENSGAAKVIAKRVRAAAALERDDKRRELMISMARVLELQRFGDGK